jgi:hypothetical protein
MNRGARTRQQPLEPLPALALRAAAEVLAIRGEGVKGDEGGWRLLRELRDARSGRVEPKLQRVEIQAVRRRDDDLAVDHAVVG